MYDVLLTSFCCITCLYIAEFANWHVKCQNVTETPLKTALGAILKFRVEHYIRL